MAVTSGTGPRTDSVRDSDDLRAAAAGWGNLRPVGRGAVESVDQWVDLLARMSHDLRTPLTAVLGYSDAMQQQLFGPIGNQRYEEYVRHIRTSGVELLHAAEDALALTAVLTQPREVRREGVALASVLAGAIEDAAMRGAARGIVTVLDVVPDVEVCSDARFLARALRQILMIALSRAAEGSRVAVGGRTEHGLVRISVRAETIAQGADPVLPHLPASGADLGLGRRDIAVWLALALLEVVDCRLQVETSGTSMVLSTVLEEAVQRDFFAGRL